MAVDSWAAGPELGLHLGRQGAWSGGAGGWENRSRRGACGEGGRFENGPRGPKFTRGDSSGQQLRPGRRSWEWREKAALPKLLGEVRKPQQEAGLLLIWGRCRGRVD